MFLGNFLIGSLKSAQQLELIQAKNLKKLQIFCRKERLDKSAEAYLIEHSDGLESVLEYSLKNYGAFQNENNDLFFKCHRANKELLLLFLKVAPLNFDYMMEMLRMVDIYPQVGELFKQSFQKLSEEDKTKFINRLKQDENLFCVFWRIVPLKITEVSLFEAFLVYYQNQPDVLNNYVSMYNLPEDFQNVLQKKHLWSLIKTYADVHQDFCFSNSDDYCAFCRTGLQIKFCVTVSTEAGIFDDEVLLLSLAAKNFIFNRENKIRFIQLYARYSKEVEAYLVQYGKDICLTEEEQFDVVKENMRLIFMLNDISSKTEALLFDDGNEHTLLEYASKRKFQYHDNEMRFLLMGRKYPKEVEAYLVQYGKDICLTEEEQFDVVKENMRLIFMLNDIFCKTEALLFDDGNEHTLLEYASKRKFQYHDNEMRFLLLGRKYPKEVEAYLVQYGKDICLTEEEQFDVVKENMRLIFILNDIFCKTEALLFDDGNEHTLLEYASKRKFQYHDNEMRFLLLGRKYPSGVEAYLVQYGKTIAFSEEEQIKFLQHQKKGIEHIKVQSPVVYRDYILPEKRKNRIPYSEEDLPMLISLSYDNPLLLEQFIIEHGRVSPKLEVELFFKADEKCRKKYIELYGVNLLNLILNAGQYGATEKEKILLNTIDHAALYFFVSPDMWKIFSKQSIGQMLVCQVGRSRYEDGVVCQDEKLCKSCTAAQNKIPIILSVLLSIARRNYLRG